MWGVEFMHDYEYCWSMEVFVYRSKKKTYPFEYSSCIFSWIKLPYSVNNTCTFWALSQHLTMSFRCIISGYTCLLLGIVPSPLDVVFAIKYHYIGKNNNNNGGCLYITSPYDSPTLWCAWKNIANICNLQTLTAPWAVLHCWLLESYFIPFLIYSFTH